MMRKPFSYWLGPIVSALLLTSVGALAQGRIDRDVVFAPEGGDCVLTGQPTTIHAKRNFVIVWRVTNHCDHEITVQIGNFTLNGEPAETPVDSRPVSVSAGKKQALLGLVLGEASVGTYNYEVLLQGGQAQDPELVIDP